MPDVITCLSEENKKNILIAYEFIKNHKDILYFKMNKTDSKKYDDLYSHKRNKIFGHLLSFFIQILINIILFLFYKKLSVNQLNNKNTLSVNKK